MGVVDGSASICHFDVHRVDQTDCLRLIHPFAELMLVKWPNLISH